MSAQDEFMLRLLTLMLWMTAKHRSSEFGPKDIARPGW